MSSINFASFKAIVSRHINEILVKADGDEQRPKFFLFPTEMKCLSDGEYFAVELSGFCQNYTPICVRDFVIRSIECYLNQSDKVSKVSAMFEMPFDKSIPAGRYPIVIAGQACLLGLDMYELQRRFPYCILNRRTFYSPRVNGQAPILFRPHEHGPKPSLILAQTQLARMHGDYPRLRSINFFLQVPKGIAEKSLRDLLFEWAGPIYLMTPCFGVPEMNALLVTTLSSVYCGGHGSEKSIEEAVYAVPNLLNVVFECVKIIRQCQLPILGTGFDRDETKLIPDAIMTFSDGSWAICDFKTALSEKAALIRGQSRRRRFSQGVAEGIAQLAHYQRYAEDPLHQEFLSTLGLSGKPKRLILIVGSMENLRRDQLSQAMSSYRDNIEIIDYDTLVTLYTEKTIFQSINWGKIYTGRDYINDGWDKFLELIKNKDG